METPTTLYCVNHPTVETGLRCNNCGDPICPKCAVRTPTGYRCKKCIRNQQKIFNTSEWFDYPIAFFISASFAFIGSLIIPFVNFFILFIAPFIGVISSEVIRRAVHKRRSNTLYSIAALGVVAGSLPALISPLSRLISGGGFNIFGLIWSGYYVFTVTSTVYYRLKGIKIR